MKSPTPMAMRCCTSKSRRFVSQIVTIVCTSSVGAIQLFGPRREAQNVASVPYIAADEPLSKRVACCSDHALWAEAM